MNKLAILCSVVLAILLPVVSLVGCQLIPTPPTTEPMSEGEIAYVEGISGWRSLGPGQSWIEARLIPADGACADISYSVELWKMGYKVQTESVVWSQSELEMRVTKTIKFYIPETELPYMKAVEDVFEVRVCKQD